MCSNTASETRRYDCDEMASAQRQINAAYGFVSRNSSWVGIATTPAQARALIQQGKLALVLAVEVTQLFPSGDYIAQLDQLRSMGVSSVQVVHHADNRFAGAAPIPKLMSAASQVEFLTGSDMTRINDIVCRNGAGSSGKCNGDTYLNERGLTADGSALVRAMMDRGMLVDVAHLSRKAFAEVYQIARQRGNYPLLYSHAHMWNTISSSEERHEKYIKQDEIQMILNTGGMVGLRPGPESTVQYGSVSNSCQGSARSFAQSRVRFLCPMSGTFSYSATNTNSAQQNTLNHNVQLTAGKTIQLGTCTVSGASGSGDTYLRLYDPNGAQVAFNDDSCGWLSYMSHTATLSGIYQIRAGCYSGNGCSGTVAYTIQIL